MVRIGLAQSGSSDSPPHRAGVLDLPRLISALLMTVYCCVPSLLDNNRQFGLHDALVPALVFRVCEKLLICQ